MSKHQTSDAALAAATARMKAAAQATEQASRAEREQAVIDAAQDGGQR